MEELKRMSTSISGGASEKDAFLFPLRAKHTSSLKMALIPGDTIGPKTAIKRHFGPISEGS